MIYPISKIVYHANCANCLKVINYCDSALIFVQVGIISTSKRNEYTPKWLLIIFLKFVHVKSFNTVEIFFSKFSFTYSIQYAYYSNIKLLKILDNSGWNRWRQTWPWTLIKMRRNSNWNWNITPIRISLPWYQLTKSSISLLCVWPRHITPINISIH